MGLGTHGQQGLTGVLQSPAGLPLDSPQRKRKSSVSPCLEQTFPCAIQGTHAAMEGSKGEGTQRENQAHHTGCLCHWLEAGCSFPTLC